MQQAVAARTPAHLWIVAILAVLWNSIGVVDYLMTRLHNDAYFAKTMPTMNPADFYAYADSLPLYASIGWGLGVWGGFLGSLLLLFRSRFAVPVFVLSMIGVVVGMGYQLAVPPPGSEGAGGKVIGYAVILIAAALLYYAWRQRAKGVLR